jgi:Pyruvate/2-oxoacid:ferredoxin oxidoreductase delta subunit
MNNKAVISAEKCDRSPGCPAMRFCPQKAISQVEAPGRGLFGTKLSVVDPEKCTGCGICMKYCPRKAVQIKEAA